jgi:uncharacterized protein DUF6913
MTNKGMRHKLASYLFYKEHARKVSSGSVVSLDDAGNVGILYDATDDNNYELVKTMVKDIRALHKDVLALGYYNATMLPQSRFIKLGLDYFTKKSLNWKMIPKSKIVSNFIANDFDILICLNNNKNVPLKYVASLSNAKFKIGRYDKNNTNIYDFMISVDENFDFKSLIKQTMYYLNQFK